MSWIIFIILLLPIVILARVSVDAVGDWLIGVLMLFVVWVVCGFVMVGTHLSRDYSKRECHSYSHQTERDVRFLQTGYWDWDCYVLTNDGWVPKGQIV